MQQYLYIRYKRKDIVDQIHNIMEQVYSDKTIAIIVSEIKSSARELYPLTKNYPMALLPVGSKKLIVYQLEALLSISSLQKIVVISSEEENLLQQFIEGNFIPSHRDYPHRIQFKIAKESANTFQALKQVLQKEKQHYKSYIIQHADTINAVPLSQVLSFHEAKSSEFTIIAKLKRELGQQQKKLPQGQVQNQIDNALIAEDGQCLFIDMMEQLQNEGVKIDPSIFRQTRRASFKRVVDSRTYIFNQRVANIILHIENDDIYQIKPDLLPILVKNQTNKNLLQLSQLSESSPLKIYVHLGEQNTYIRKVSSKKIYETLNFDSIIRGPKQKDVLMPTIYSDKLDERQAYKGNASVIQSSAIGLSAKLRRSCIGNNCKIGKNVEILNSILLDNVEIKDNCKIIQSILGSGCSIGEGVTIKSTYAEGGCRVADGANIESEVLIKGD